jgi:hypothetical protein
MEFKVLKNKWKREVILDAFKIDIGKKDSRQQNPVNGCSPRVLSASTGHNLTCILQARYLKQNFLIIHICPIFYIHLETWTDTKTL